MPQLRIRGTRTESGRIRSYTFYITGPNRIDSAFKMVSERVREGFERPWRAKKEHEMGSRPRVESKAKDLELTVAKETAEVRK